MLKKFFLIFLFFASFIASSTAERIEKIVISGNERITSNTIVIFGEIDKEIDFTDDQLNKILKNLYETNFFEDVKVNITDKVLNIIVVESPIVQEVKILGIKANKLKDPLFESLKIK